jgi:hypothetical protein
MGVTPKDNTESQSAVIELVVATIGDGTILLRSCCQTEAKTVNNCNNFGV